jgi:hypothetical protein
MFFVIPISIPIIINMKRYALIFSYMAIPTEVHTTSARREGIAKSLILIIESTSKNIAGSIRLIVTIAAINITAKPVVFSARHPAKFAAVILSIVRNTISLAYYIPSRLVLRVALIHSI